jgi:lauroyl/myristoyl acyltransferase
LTMHFAHQDPMLSIKMLAALRKGEIVAVQGDRPRAQGRFHTVEIFGRETRFPLGPTALARAAGVPLLPVYVFRRGRRRSEVVFRPLIYVPNTPGEEVLHEAVEKMAREVEWAVRQDPYQWFCFQEVWPEPTKALSAPGSK